MPSAGVATSVTQNAKDEVRAGAVLRNLHAVETAKFYLLTNPYSISMKVARALLLSAAKHPDTKAGRIAADTDNLAAMQIIFALRARNCDLDDGSAKTAFREGHPKDYQDLYLDRLYKTEKASARSWADLKTARLEAIVMIDRSKSNNKGELVTHSSIVFVEREILQLIGSDFPTALSFIDGASRAPRLDDDQGLLQGVSLAFDRARKDVTAAFGVDFRGDARPDIVASRTNEPRKLVRAIAIVSQISLKTKSEARSRLAGLEPVDCAGLIGAQNGDSLNQVRIASVLTAQTSVCSVPIPRDFDRAKQEKIVTLVLCRARHLRRLGITPGFGGKGAASREPPCRVLSLMMTACSIGTNESFWQ